MKWLLFVCYIFTSFGLCFFFHSCFFYLLFHCFICFSSGKMCIENWEGENGINSERRMPSIDLSMHEQFTNALIETFEFVFNACFINTKILYNHTHHLKFQSLSPKIKLSCIISNNFSFLFSLYILCSLQSANVFVSRNKLKERWANDSIQNGQMWIESNTSIVYQIT